MHIHLCPAGVTTTSLFYLQPCVYLRGKQTLLSLVWWEMPCFLYAKNLVPFFNSFYDFGRTPSTSEHAILSHHDYNNFFTTSFWQFHLPHIFDITETSVFHVEGATRDCINYRAVKRRPSRYCSRWLDLGRIPKNFRVTHGVGAVCVYAGILWGDVDVSDLLTFICVGLVIKQHHPSSTSKDGISRIELWYKIDFLDKILNFLWGLFLLLPLIFPDLNHFIPHLLECLTFVSHLLT